MDKIQAEDVIYDIEKFLEVYAGTAVGHYYKNWYENAEEDPIQIVEIYEDLKADGYL